MKKNAVARYFIIFGVFFLLLGAALLFGFYEGRRGQVKSPSGNPTRGIVGLSRLVVGDAVVSVEGGFIKTFSKSVLRVRATSLSPTIMVNARNSSKAVRLVVKVDNVRADNAQTPAPLELIREDSNTLSFTLDVPAREQRIIPIYPPANPYRFTFFVLGDNRDGKPVFQKILRQINQKRPLFALDGGDLVSNGEKWEYLDFEDTIAAVNVPLFTALGNHDIRNGGRRTYQYLLAPDYYAFSFGNSQFIVLDSSTRGLGDAQFRWLEETLNKASAAGKNIFIFSHVPPFDPVRGQNRGFSNPNERAAFVELMKRYRVTRVYASHLHSYFSEKRDGVPYIITGGAGAPLVSTKDFFHYVEVTIDGNRVTEKVVKIPASKLVSWRPSLVPADLRIRILSIFLFSLGSVLILAGIAPGLVAFIKNSYKNLSNSL
ncbi:MAG: metallophosphoesterase [Actinomycetota bacterium]